MDEQEKEAKEKEVARIDLKIIRLERTMKETGMSHHEQERRLSLFKEIRNLKFQRADLLEELFEYENSLKS